MKGISKLWVIAAATTALFASGCAGGYVTAGYPDPVEYYSGPYYDDPFFAGPDIYIYPGLPPRHYYGRDFHRHPYEHRFHQIPHTGRPPGAVHGHDRGGWRGNRR